MIDLSLLRINDGVLQRLDKRYRAPEWKDCSNVPNADGYIRVNIGGKALLKHRVVYSVVHGYIADTVDHIDGDKSNNHPCNLRDIPQAMQSRNRGVSSSNKSGVNGVHWSRRIGKWVAQVALHGKRKHLGLFTDLSAAKTAVLNYQAIEGGYTRRHGL
tara:strand:- start:6 stop:479 length:474 start_codon:yes stop_codon:yes gene_type:complete